MTSQDFAKAFYDEKENLLDIYFARKQSLYDDSIPKSDVAEHIKKLNLDKDRQDVLFKIVDGVLRDTLYTILLGLDGSASIGDRQELYELKDEEGNILTGDIEGFAYEYFHGLK